MSAISVPTPTTLAPEVTGKVTIVTGAASGIGYATAQLFAHAGAQVILADRDEELGRQAASAIGHNCTFIKCDVTSWHDQLHLFTDTYSRYGKIDIAVLNAGIDPEIILERSDKEDSVREARSSVKFNFLADEVEDGDEGLLKSPPSTILDVNVTGAIYGVKLGVHFLSKSAAGGRIVVIGSAAGYLGYSQQAIYCASKHAVVGLVRATSGRAELKENNIAISLVAPWLTLTPLTGILDASTLKGVLASTGEDVAFAVAYLATGSRENVNGKGIWVQGQTYTEVEGSISECHGKMIKM
ncbi:putative gluconate 5-dehydrogenase [Leptodontidium sp. 2 PMI_412]|nr:putative gluconate 5-dehydrogenase [Leptodontidium sp. 2 PMI_412]